ncbi:MAG: LytTR family DNA-binding domain-containing protein [Bacteroidota bacterium]|nr:LytTR family DNA-binding domain-containing protein [Bacteroidota bacterium]
MIQALIIDDEQHCIDSLSLLLKENYSQSVKEIGACHSVEEGVRAIRELKPGLVFLDVEMRNQTGFDLLQQIGEINFEVIFITAHEKYAVQAFRFSAFDYLLKPVNRNQLVTAIDKLKEKFSQKEQSQKIETLFHNLKTMTGVSRKISIPTGNGLLFPEVNEIIRCESDSNYTHIYLKDQQKITVARTLREFEELLADCNFYRVHNSHLINLSFIKSYQKGKGGMVTLTDNTQIEVSVRRKEQFLKKISEM